MLDSKSIPIVPNTHTPTLIHAPEVCSRIHSLLSHLWLPGLLRSGRLRADIRILTGTPEHGIDEALQLVAENGQLAALIEHTKKAVDANPHVILAYSWVLYMALFSGGRYLRALLQGAGGVGHEFWEREPSRVRPYAVTEDSSQRRASKSSDFREQTNAATRARARSRSEGSIPKMIPGLQFFNFPGDEDGEDIKIEFKKRIAEAEILLTHGEKEDIIAEAKVIFEFMVEMIGELDKFMGTDEDDLEAAQKIAEPQTSRDSIFLSHKRLSKKVSTAYEVLEKDDSGLLGFLVGVPTTEVVGVAPANAEKSQDRQCGGDVHTRRKINRVSFDPALGQEPKESIGVRSMARTTALAAAACIVVILLWYLY